MRRLLISAFSVFMLQGAAVAAPLTRAEMFRRAQAMAEIGRQIFADPTLSGSGQMACASCHSPTHAFGPPDGAAVRMGGRDMHQPGVRAVPSLTYLQVVPPFTEHFFESDDEGDESIDNGPTGGLTWDGRVDQGSEQARIPLLSPYEMANRDAAEVTAKLGAAPYAPALRALFGADLFDDADRALGAAAQSLEAYEEDYRSFYPYSSKYDAYLAGTATLSAQESRGLALFDDPTKGNCARCHVSTRGGDGTPPQFTDYGFIALGAPRNPAIPANADPTYYDLGLCGPLRTDFRDRAAYCGLFMTPTLRNVAVRSVFFHNGVFHTLREVMAFYAQRDTNPEKWYSRNPDGSVHKFDDLPEKYVGNVETDLPFGGKQGDPPTLNDQEIDDIIAFLQTLTDGYRPP